ncbi:protodermal factor 1-like [Populus alba x Populus x berolinensis]|nr:protodermal factor 1-like [Populus alba x Populus x berolinensis]
MEKQESKQASMLIMWVLAAGLLSHNLAFPVLATTFEDQKNFYFPDPHSRSPPSGSHGTPSHGSGGSSVNPPSHSTPSTPSGGGYNPTPSNPPRGGGYHPTPPTTGGSPPTPVIVSPPTTPSITPGTPFTPTPPFIPDPNSPFSCNYWRTHPALIGGVLGWWGTMGNAFGVTSLPGFGTSMTLQQALSNTRTDGYGTLYREGTASLLNSMVSNRFPFTTRQVRENFVASLASNKAAGAQGHLFKLANEGRLKPRV